MKLLLQVDRTSGIASLHRARSRKRCDRHREGYDCFGHFPSCSGWIEPGEWYVRIALPPHSGEVGNANWWLFVRHADPLELERTLDASRAGGGGAVNLAEIIARHHDELRLLRLAIDDRDARIQSLEAIVALAEQRADESDDALIRLEGELSRLCAVYMAAVLP